MILGQAEESESTWPWAIASGLVGGVATAAIDALGALKRSVTGEPKPGGDTPLEILEDELPYIPETPEDVTGVVGVSKSRARKPSATSPSDEGDYSAEANGGGSVWPWILGAGLLAGGAYWFVKRRKRRGKKGK